MTETVNRNKALLWAADWLEESAPANDEVVTDFARKIAMTFRSPGATDSVGGPHSDREEVIEQCAARLEWCSHGFIEVGNLHPEGVDKDAAYGMADTYQMAAEELRMMIPSYSAWRSRNMEKIKDWMKALKRGEEPPIPELEDRP